MIYSFEQYIKERKVQKQLPDSNRARALINKAEKRLKYLQEINDETAELVFEDIYEAMREAAQSLMAVKGFKPLSHEAVVAYLRDMEKLDVNLIHQLDSYGKLRNHKNPSRGSHPNLKVGV